MSTFPDGFLWGAATAAHQVEGGNVNNDHWELEHAEHSPFAESSGDACDSFHRWPEDLDLVAGAGLTSYRFSLEWSRIEPAPGNALYVVALVDRSEQKRIEEAVAVGTAELAATLESVADGVLVVDLAGHISHFNRRFAALWELPDEMLLLHADDEIFDWMRQRVADPGAYMRRLAEIEGETMLRATDTLALRSGGVLERVTLPQLSRGRARALPRDPPAARS